MNISHPTPLQKLVLSAMFVAIGLVLPFLTGQIQQIGNLLLPMHLPVFLCGLICGPQYGATVGVVVPLLRSFLFGMPPMYPVAIAMAVELACYGVVIGLVYRLRKKRDTLGVYISLVSAMILGRVMWGVAQVVLLGLQGNAFTWKMFVAGAFLNAIPGIIVQLILIPAIMSALHVAGTRQERVSE